MTLFSRINKDNEPYKKFIIQWSFPIIRKIDIYNEWSDEKYNGFEMDFETRCRYIYTKDFKQFDLILFGFGVTIVKED
jgi:hypothetical protein